MNFRLHYLWKGLISSIEFSETGVVEWGSVTLSTNASGLQGQCGRWRK